MNRLTYRPEIDGLRAVAVVAVVLFHLGFGFTGGYVGVDVFFVISGFLITGLILKAQSQGEFSLREFWLRRVRRLAPAMMMLQVVVLSLGMWLLLPHELKDLADSSLAQICMVSNYYFADELDYFAGPAELMPLLHTWSLAVEEQFYLLLPVLLVLCRRLSRRRLFILLAAIAIASFGYSAWGVYEYPQHTFFLLATRAWELLLGSLLAFAPMAKQPRVGVRNVLACAGVGGVIASCFLFDGMTPFPGTAALLPCVSTAVIIYATAGCATWVGRLLSAMPLVGVGQISYSLYLWHWPVIVLLKYEYGLHLGPLLGIVAIAFSFLLGYLSWKYVETPFRRGQLLPGWGKLVTATAACALAIAVVSGVSSLTRGLPKRYTDAKLHSMFDNKANKRYMVFHPETIAKDELPTLGVAEGETPQHPQVLVWGDSHALRAYYPCEELAHAYGVTGFIASRGATVPLVDTWRRGFGERRGPNGDAVRWNDEVVELVKRHKIAHVILIARWEIYIEPLPGGGVHDSMIKDAESVEHTPQDSALVFRRGLQRTVQALQDAGAKVWVMKQVPLLEASPVRQLVRAVQRGEPPPRGVTLAEHYESQKNANNVLDPFAAESVALLDPTDVCFDESGSSLVGTSQHSYYFDEDHLSPHGAKVLLRPVLEPVFQEIAAEMRMAKAEQKIQNKTSMR